MKNNAESNKKKTVYEDTSYLLKNGEVIKKPFYIQYRFPIIIAVAIILVILFIVLISGGNKSKKCRSMENLVIEAAQAYAKEKELLPTLEGNAVVIEVADLIKENKLDVSKLSFKDTPCGGSVKITRYKEEYINTLNLTDCNYCTTENRYSNWSKEVSKKPKKQIVDVIPYYNYYEVELYNTDWTKWMASSEVSKEKSTYDNYLPVDEKDLPKVPEAAFINHITQETQNYYRYRDQQWKYYKIVGNYSDFSSEQPAGYTTKDTSTQILTEYSKWSPNYPDRKEYRTIQTGTGYQWYYVNKKNKKVYWNNGEYLVEAPDDQYTEKTKNSIPMYRYQDKMWRWYTGTQRGYSGFNSTMPRGYNYRDNELTKFTSWTSWKPESFLTNENSAYRIQETDVYSRYRIQYGITSFIILDKALNREDFEKETGRTVEEMAADEHIKLEISYKFIYRK